ncbi:MAG: hypothetical protein KGI50_04225 [Patescibacteria group bacterium]|nr:hypothetical protein [Patescibacteria group bacterium]MDE2438507.1 hypothetical protein [Patescibacteria group bacterium]
MKRLSFAILLLLVTMFLGAGIFSLVSAAPPPGDVTLSAGLPGTGNTQEIKPGETIHVQTLDQLTNYLSTLIRFLFGLAAVLAVVSIAWAGLQYMAAGASIGNMRAATDRIRNVIFGLVLLLTGFLILRTINPKILSGLPGEEKLPFLPIINAPQVQTQEVTMKVINQTKAIKNTNVDTYVQQRLTDNGGNQTKAISATTQILSEIRVRIAKENEELNNLKNQINTTSDPTTKAQLESSYGESRGNLQRDQASLAREQKTLQVLQSQSNTTP